MILTIVSSFISLCLLFSKRRTIKTRPILIFHIPSIVLVSYFLLSLIANPVSLIASLLLANSESKIEFSSPTGQKTAVFYEDCDLLECSHGTRVYLNFGIFRRSLEMHENNQHLCTMDNPGFEALKARKTNLRWSDREKQLEWNTQGGPCILRL